MISLKLMEETYQSKSAYYNEGAYTIGGAY